MNKALRNELAWIAGIAAAGLWLSGKNKLALSAGTLALGLRAFPGRAYRLEGRTVVITGGSRGLGMALAEECLSQGARVAILARSAAELERARRALAQVGRGEVFPCVCDVTQRAAVDRAFARIARRFGRIDALINNAGSVSAAPFGAMTVEDFEAQINLHLYAVLHTVQAALPYLKKVSDARIVNISSIGGRIPVPHMAPYCTSKFALSGFSQTLTAELAREGIRVTTVYPGLMRTGSPIQGIFKGDAEREFAWFALSDSLPGLTISARSAARQTIAALRSGRAQAILSWPAKLGHFAQANFPEIFHAAIDVANRALPTRTDGARATGAASRGWLDRQAWSAPFRAILTNAEMHYNEKVNFDPERDMNRRH